MQFYSVCSCLVHKSGQLQNLLLCSTRQLDVNFRTIRAISKSKKSDIERLTSKDLLLPPKILKHLESVDSKENGSTEKPRDVFSMNSLVSGCQKEKDHKNPEFPVRTFSSPTVRVRALLRDKQYQQKDDKNNDLNSECFMPSIKIEDEVVDQKKSEKSELTLRLLSFLKSREAKAKDSSEDTENNSKNEDSSNEKQTKVSNLNSSALQNISDPTERIKFLLENDRKLKDSQNTDENRKPIKPLSDISIRLKAFLKNTRVQAKFKEAKENYLKRFPSLSNEQMESNANQKSPKVFNLGYYLFFEKKKPTSNKQKTKFTFKKKAIRLHQQSVPKPTKSKTKQSATRRVAK